MESFIVQSDQTISDTVLHSSEIRGLLLMKCPSKMLQNLLYFWNTKTHVNIDQGIH